MADTKNTSDGVPPIVLPGEAPTSTYVSFPFGKSLYPKQPTSSVKPWNWGAIFSRIVGWVGIISAIALTVLNFGDALKLYHLSFVDTFAKLGISDMSNLAAGLTTAGIGVAGLLNLATAHIYVKGREEKEDWIEQNKAWSYFISITGTLLGIVAAGFGTAFLSPVSLVAMGFAIMPAFGWHEVSNKSSACCCGADTVGSPAMRSGNSHSEEEAGCFSSFNCCGSTPSATPTSREPSSPTFRQMVDGTAVIPDSAPRHQR